VGNGLISDGNMSIVMTKYGLAEGNMRECWPRKTSANSASEPATGG
jgi:hypothetical protein